MATYVPGFEYDVFISYSHFNNHEQWVSKFREKLEARLKERVPPGAKFFFDTAAIQGNDDLTPEIVEGIRRTAVLVPIVSRGYLDSKWCQKECREFIDANAQRGIDGRIFPVRYEDISPAEFQTLLGEKLGYEFFAKSAEDKYADRLSPDDAAFQKAMNVLRSEVGAKLQELKDRAARTPGNVPPPNEPRLSTSPTVFLAEPAPGLGDFADQLTCYLKGLKYQVVRPGEKFYDLKNYESAFADGLKQSLLFVQLLGRKFNPRDDDAVPSWDRWQFLQAQAAGLPTFRWFNKYDKNQQEIPLENLDDDHRKFVTETGVWNCDTHRFRELVRAEIEKRFHNLRQQERVSIPNGPQPLVVLRADRPDRQFAEQIGKNLNQRNCDWFRVPDKEVATLEDFAKEQAANGMLVVYRACPGRWVLTRLQELRKFVKTDYGQRWACGLWRAPENDEEAVSCSVDGLFVIEPNDPGQLDDFVAQVRSRSSNPP